MQEEEQVGAETTGVGMGQKQGKVQFILRNIL